MSRCLTAAFSAGRCVAYTRRCVFSPITRGDFRTSPPATIHARPAARCQVISAFQPRIVWNMPAMWSGRSRASGISPSSGVR